MRTATGDDGVAVGAWRFAPHDGVSEPYAESVAFRWRLGRALRSAHGLGVRLACELSSGPGCGVRLFAEDGPSARWVARVLGPVYGTHRWVAASPAGTPTREDGEVEARGRRAHAWPEPLATPELPNAGFDTAALAFATLGPGVTLRWSWTALAPPRVRWWVGPPPLPALAGPRPRPVAGEGRSATPPPTGRPEERPLFGRLDLSLRRAPHVPGVPSRDRAVAALEAALRSPRGNGVVFSAARRAPFRWGHGGMLVTVEEWAALWPTRVCPVGEEAPGGGRDLGSLLPLGRTPAGALVAAGVDPHQGRHLAVLGETGMGKSSLLVALGRRVLAGAGGVVFDPLGETASAVRAALPEAARARLVWIAPTGDSPAVNALEGIVAGPDPESVLSERRLNDLVHALRRVRSGRYEESSYWGPRLEEMVTRALRAAAALPRGTLVDAHTLLSTSARLGRPVPPAAVEPVRELADRIRDRPEDADGARRLLYEVVRSPVLRRMLCEPEPRLLTRDLVAPGRLVVVSGDAASVGETASRYLLSIYLALIWSELLARPGSPKTFVVLDEAQWFSHESLAEMLRLGRRRNVHVVLATQAIASLAPVVSEAVWTNVSDFVAFRGSPEEAREFARASRSVTAEEILALPRGHAAVLLGKGHQVRWVRTVRLPASDRLGSSDPDLSVSGNGGPPGSDGRGAPGFSSDQGGDPDPGSQVPASAGAPDPARAVAEELLRRLDAAGPGPAIRVPLAELRGRHDPGGDGVRRVGTELGRRGLLERVEATPGGPAWCLPARARDGLLDLVGRAPSRPAPREGPAQVP